MSVKIIDVPALNKICLDVVVSKYPHWNVSNHYFYDLYSTGCRPSELLQIHRWSYKNGVYYLNTLKTEAQRMINPSQLTVDFKDCVISQTAPYSGLTYDQLILDFRKAVSRKEIFVGNRRAELYLFRYNRARQLYTDTQNMGIVMQFFGWYSSTIASNYVTTPITLDLQKALYR